MALTYAPGRGGKYTDGILQSFAGILQVPSRGLQTNPCRATDGYAGYNRLLKRGRQYRPNCAGGPDADCSSYRIEAEIKGRSADARLAARIERTKPKLETFEKWLSQSRAQVSAESPTGEALKYITKYWGGLNLFLTDGCIEIDNNLTSR